jgi:hypothetical protein
MATKICKTCEVSKGIEYFTINKKLKDGRCIQCKECEKKKREQNKDKVAEQRKKRIEKWRENPVEYTEKTCKGCGLLKKLEEYSENKIRKDGKENRCKECTMKKRNSKVAEQQQNLSNITQVGKKICNTCGVSKSMEDYTNNRRYKDGKENRCKECLKEKNKINKDRLRQAQKKWRAKNPEYMKKYEKTDKRKAYLKTYYAENSQSYIDRKKQNRKENSERDSEVRKKYIETHKDKINEYHRKWKRKQRNDDPTYKLKENTSRRIRYELNTLLKGKKAKKTIEYIGCSIEELKSYIESLFDINMSWSNYGSCWHIDHIIPCDAWDLTQEMDNYYCWNFRNLQPLFSNINQSKKNKYDQTEKAKYIQKMNQLIG